MQSGNFRQPRLARPRHQWCGMCEWLKGSRGQLESTEVHGCDDTVEAESHLLDEFSRGSALRTSHTAAPSASRAHRSLSRHRSPRSSSAKLAMP